MWRKFRAIGVHGPFNPRKGVPSGRAGGSSGSRIVPTLRLPTPKGSGDLAGSVPDYSGGTATASDRFPHAPCAPGAPEATARHHAAPDATRRFGSLSSERSVAASNVGPLETQSMFELYEYERTRSSLFHRMSRSRVFMCSPKRRNL